MTRVFHCLLALELSDTNLARKSAITHALVPILFYFDQVIWFDRRICILTFIDGHLKTFTIIVDLIDFEILAVFARLFINDGVHSLLHPIYTANFTR